MFCQKSTGLFFILSFTFGLHRDDRNVAILFKNLLYAQKYLFPLLLLTFVNYR